MYQVGIVGPEATGKTTLASYLYRRYGGKLVLEYGRYYMEEMQGKPYNFFDVENIAKHQIDMMCKMRKENPTFVFYDTELIITKVWFLHKYNFCPPWLLQAIKDYPMDVYLLCYPDIQWQWQVVRENGDTATRLYLYKLYEAEIQRLGIPYYIVRHNDE